MNAQDIQLQQLFLNDPLCKISMLFPRRILKQVNNQVSANFQKIKIMLKCYLCSYTLHNPVLLPCSHRFCKSCLNDYMRSKENINCPSCKGQLLRKRQLRYDFQLLTLVKSISQSQQTCLITYSSITDNRQSWIDIGQNQLGFQPRKRIKNSSIQSKHQTKFTKNYLQMQKVQSKQALENTQLKKMSANQVPKKVKQYILQESIFQNKIRKSQPQRKQQKISKKSTVIVQKANGEKTSDEFQNNNLDKFQAQQASTQQHIPLQQLVYTENMLIQQFGNLYISKLLKMDSSCFSISICLIPINKRVRIPNLQHMTYKISLNVTVADIKNLINYCLNLEFESLQVQIATYQSEDEQFLQNSVTILEIIKQYWKDFSQCQYFTFSDIICWLQGNKQVKQPRILYYYLISMISE